MTANYTVRQAFDIAVAYAHLNNNKPRLVSLNLEDGLYHMIIRASFLDYEFYVDAKTGEVLGLDTQPNVDNEFQSALFPASTTYLVVDDTDTKSNGYAFTLAANFFRKVGRKAKNA